MVTIQTPIYFEPNTNDYNTEDLNIGIALEIELLERGVFQTNIVSGETILHRNVNFFQGEDNLLTTSYSDITIMELSNGGNKESIGIESINIKYNSWYFPEINIKFVDVRGNSVFNPMEMTNDINRTEAKGSFFNCLFQFPYPIFKLTVKGYYGKPVTYKLTVKDVRAQFNSKTGNFEINVNFTGYMYGYLTDVPMSLLFAAPYINYDNIDSNLGRFSNGEWIPTFVDFVREINESLKNMGNNDAITENRRQLATISDNLKLINEILAIIKRIDDIFTWFFEKTVNGNNITLKFSLAKYSEDNHGYTNQETIAQIIVDGINGAKMKWNSLDTSLVNSATPAIATNVELTMNTSQDYNNFIFENGRFKETFILKFNKDNDEKILNDISSKLKNDTEQIGKQIEAETDNVFSQTLNWQPTIKHIFEMVLSHLDKFHANMERCIGNIDSERDNRKMSKLKHETDCNTHGDDITVYPFPAFYDSDNQYVWIGDTDASNYSERYFVETLIDGISEAQTEMTTAMEEYLNSTVVQSTFPQNGIPVLFYDLAFGNEYRNQIPDGELKNVVIQNDNNSLPEIFKILAYRLILWKMFNFDLTISPKEFGEIEAINMLSISKGADDFPSDSLWTREDTTRYKELFQTLVDECLNKMNAYYDKFKENNDYGKYPFTYADIENNSWYPNEDSLYYFSGSLDTEHITKIGRFVFEYFNNANRDFELEYDNIMAGVQGTLMNENINIEEYQKSFPNKKQDISIYENGDALLDRDKKYKGTFIDLSHKGLITADEIKEYIEAEGAGDANLHELAELVKDDEKTALILSIKNGEANFDSIYEWVNRICDFYPCFKSDDDSPMYTLSKTTIGEIAKKETWWAKRFNKSKEAKVHLSFSCMKYWDDVNMTASTARNDNTILEQVLNDFFKAIGFTNLNIDEFIKLSKCGITKIPTILLLYIGSIAVDDNKIFSLFQPMTGEMRTKVIQWFDKLPIIKKAKELYTNTWQMYAQRLIDEILTSKVAGDSNYNELVCLFTDKNKEMYCFRALDSYRRTALTDLLSETTAIFNLYSVNSDDVPCYMSSAYPIRLVFSMARFRDITSSVIDGFISKVRSRYGFNPEQQPQTEQPINENTTVSINRKLGVYDTLKQLYDRWKFGNMDKSNVISIKNFTFKNSYNQDVGEKYNVNIEKIAGLINSIYKGGNDMSVYEFLFAIADQADFLMVSLPIDVYGALDSIDKLKDIFTPFQYSSVLNSNTTPTFVLTYRQKDSQHLSFGTNTSQYKDDGIDFKNEIVKSSNTDNTMGVFGITYGLSDQRFFKDIQVGMDKPKMTEQSIASMMYIAEQGDKSTTNKIGRAYHDLFDTYSNHSYTCTVNMMGNVQIMPLMHFQLNNIPLFKGGYRIISAEHTINNDGMTTTFVGVRLNKHIFNLDNKSALEPAMRLDKSDYGNDNSDASSGQMTSEGAAIQNQNLKDQTNLVYSKEKTKILIDAAHHMSVSGKQSPDLNGEGLFSMDDPERVGNGSLNPYDVNGNEVFRYREYWGCRKIAVELYNLLKKNGYNVECVFHSEKNAKNYSNFTSKVNGIYEEQKRNGGSTIIVSLHSNAAANSGWGGGNRWEIYKQSSEYVSTANEGKGGRIYAPNPETSDILARNIAKAADSVFEELYKAGKCPTFKNKRMSVVTEPKTFENRETTYGIRPTTYSKAPAVLSENLFHDTREHVQFLASQEGRNAIVKLHYDGIVNFFEEMAKRK